MKKIKLFITVMLFSVILGFSSCNSCNNNVTEPETETVETAVINVENTIAMDREAMYLKGGDYRWFETCILLPEFLDSENVISDPEMVSNVFQRIVERDNGADTWVYKFQHFPDGTCLVDSVRGFWIEDNPLNDEEIALDYMGAFDRIMQANAPKPHSKQACLRKPVGPLPCNAQYVFGNIREQLWVDAKTMDVRTSNPAFPEDTEGFKMPLGEWP